MDYEGLWDSILNALTLLRSDHQVPMHTNHTKLLVIPLAIDKIEGPTRLFLCLRRTVCRAASHSNPLNVCHHFRYDLKLWFRRIKWVGLRLDLAKTIMRHKKERHCT